MLQVLTSGEWATERYRSDPPNVPTLRRYAKQNSLCPPAMRQGRLWRMCGDAELVGELVTPIVKKNDSLFLQRILSNGSQTA